MHINWHKIPFLRLLLPFIVGILIMLHLETNHFLLLIGLLTLPILLIGLRQMRIPFRFRSVFGIILNIWLVLLGMYLTFWNHPAHYSTYFGHVLQDTTFAIAKIVDIPVHKNTTKIPLQILKIGSTTENMKSTTGKALCYLEKDSLSQQLQYGDYLVIRSRFQPIESPKNPNQFNYKRYLFFKGIHYQVYVPKENWRYLKSASSWELMIVATRWRTYFLKTLQTYLPTADEFSVGSALILGYKAAITDEIQTAYASTGAMHVLAVSGLHVGIIALFLNIGFNQIKWHSRHWQWLKTGLIVLSLWVFALLTGLSASVARAATMFSFVVIGHNLHRRTNIYNTLAASAFVLLVYNPYYLMEVGFQLSYVAVLGIVLLTPKIKTLWIIENRFWRYCWQLTAVSIAAQIATLPLSLFYFHQFPVWFWLSSLIVIPAAGVILGVGLGLLAFSWLPYLNQLLGSLLYGLIWLVNQGIFTIQALPFGLIRGIWLSPIQFGLLLFAVMSFIYLVYIRKLKYAFAPLLFLVVFFSLTAFTKYHQIQQRQLIVYHISKHTAIDFIHKTSTITLKDTKLTAKHLRFATENHQMALGIQKTQCIDFQYTLTTSTFKKQHQLIQFYDKTLAIVDTRLSLIPPSPVTVDYVIVRQNPRLYMSQLLKIFNFKTVVFDASNPIWKVNLWKADCKKLGIDCWDTRVDGAFVVDITN